MKTIVMVLALGAVLSAVALAGGCKKGAQAEQSGITVSQAPSSAASAVQVTPAAGGETAASAEICAGCGKPESECTCEEGAEGAAKEGAAKAGCSDPNCKGCADEKGGTIASAGSKTSDGITIVDATILDTNPAAYAGRIAIHGKVGQVMGDKGVFTLVDLKKMPGCKDGCCPKTDIPIQVPSKEYTGTLPKAEDEVTVVGILITTSAGGYQISVEEVRQNEKAIMTRAAGKPA